MFIYKLSGGIRMFGAGAKKIKRAPAACGGAPERRTGTLNNFTVND